MHTDLHSQWAHHDADQKLLTSEQHVQECWHHESPSTDALYGYITQLTDSWLHLLAWPVNAAISTMQVASLKEKWQAHARTACLGRDRCTVLRHQLMLNEEPAAVEAELCEEAAEQQRSAQEDKRTEPAAGTEVHGQQRLPTPDPVRSTDATVSHQ